VSKNGDRGEMGVMVRMFYYRSNMYLYKWYWFGGQGKSTCWENRVSVLVGGQGKGTGSGDRVRVFVGKMGKGTGWGTG
jgi:hypothetical protein